MYKIIGAILPKKIDSYKLGNKDEYPIKNDSLKRIFYLYR